VELTVVIPTRDRRAILRETLSRLERQAGGVIFEIKVVDDGSPDGTRELVREMAARRPIAIELIEQPGQGSAAARNRALSVAKAPVCLFLNDDTWAHRDLLTRHRDFHLLNPRPTAALLGSIVLPRSPRPTPLMRWLQDQCFDYAGIDDPEDVGGGRFFTANVSAKTRLLRQVGGFGEAFPSAAHEDIDLGLRLEKRGMRLAYDPDAIVEHFHPMDIAAAIERMRGIGRGLAPFVERHPAWPVPRRPGVRHRVKAAALTAVAAIGAAPPRVQREIWRFLCHEATRESYWEAVDNVGRGADDSDRALRIGARLAHMASDDEDASMPQPSEPRAPRP